MFKTTLKISRNLFLLGYLGLLVACASASKEYENGVDESLSQAAPLDGIWKGEFDIRGRGPYDFTAVQLNDKAFAFSLKAKAMCIGTFTFDGKHTLHKYVLFALDGGPFDWATLTGTVSNNEAGQEQILSHFKTLNGGDTGALNIAYSEIYNQPSSLEFVHGDWIYTDRDELTSTIEVDEQGLLTGSDTDNCQFIGKVRVINSKYNAYHTSISISECGSTSGDYEGVSFLDNGIFTMQIANPQYALHYAFHKK
ncbi:MAG: hypothetical protein AAF304_03865 [Pseudomonadota bacterium]